MAALWCWTMIYDTIYACLDKKDDVKIGIGSTALYFGQSLVPALTFLAIGFLALLLLSGILNGQGAPYYVVCVGGAALFFITSLSTLDFNSSSSCWDFFMQNAYYLGSIVYAGLLIDYTLLIRA